MLDARLGRVAFNELDVAELGSKERNLLIMTCAVVALKLIDARNARTHPDHPTSFSKQHLPREDSFA